MKTSIKIIIQTLIIIIFVYNSIDATLIVVIYNKSNIWIAADSRIVKNEKAVDNFEKIIQFKNWFIIRGGFVETKPNSKSITDRLIQKAIINGDIISASVDLEKEISDEFTALLLNNKNRNTKSYQLLLDEKRSELSTLILCSFVNERPYIKSITWTLMFDNLNNPYVKAVHDSINKPIESNKNLWFAVGQTEMIKREIYSKQNELQLSQMNPIDLIDHLYSLELGSRPSTDFKQKVGLPIDILHIDLKNAQWIQKKKLCPEIEKYWNN